MKYPARILVLNLLPLGFSLLGSHCLSAQTVVGPTSALDFGSVNICAPGQSTPAPCSKTLTLTYHVKAGGALGATRVLTLGAPNLDFTLASGGTCVGTVASGMTCTINVKFAPRFPGPRPGGVQLTDGDAHVLATTLIYGNGEGSQIVLGPVAKVAVPVTGLSATNGDQVKDGVALDGAGDLFIADYAHNQVVKLSAGGGAQTTIGSGWKYPSAVAVDGAGNLYVADSSNNRVVKIEEDASIMTTVGSGLSNPSGLALDAAGDVFIVDVGNNRVVEVPVCGGAQLTIYAPGDLASLEQEVAADGLGNVFVGTTAYSNDGAGDFTTTVSVIKIPVGGSAPTTVYSESVTNVEGVEYSADIGPVGLAVDGGGNLYVSYYDTVLDEIEFDQYHGIVEIPAGTDTQTLLFDESGSPYFYPQTAIGPMNITVDETGTLFYVDLLYYNVDKLVRTAPALAFQPTAAGTASPSQSVSVLNIGNAPLKFSGVNVSANFEQVAGSGTPPDCSEKAPLAAGATCNLNFSFLPTEVGALTGLAQVTDNSLNPAGSTQDIPLSGTGAVPALKVTTNRDTITFPTIKFGEQNTIFFNVINTGNGAVTIDPVISGPSFTVSQNSCGSTIEVGTECSMYVLYSPVTVGTHSDVLTLKTNAPANPKIKLSGAATGVGSRDTWLYYGSIPYGSRKTLPLTIQNYGVARNVTVKTSISGPSFKILSTGNTCLTGVVSGQSCTMQVEYSPVATGGHLDILTVTASSGTVSTVKLGGFATAP